MDPNEKEEVPVPRWPLLVVTVNLMNSGDRISLTAHFKTHISVIKDMIETQTGISMEENCLVYFGKVMDEGLTLNDYHVSRFQGTIDVHSKGDTCKYNVSILFVLYRSDILWAWNTF